MLNNLYVVQTILFAANRILTITTTKKRMTIITIIVLKTNLLSINIINCMNITNFMSIKLVIIGIYMKKG